MNHSPHQHRITCSNGLKCIESFCIHVIRWLAWQAPDELLLRLSRQFVVLDLIALDEGSHGIMPSFGVFVFDLPPVFPLLAAAEPFAEDDVREAAKELLNLMIVMPTENGKLRPTNGESGTSCVHVVSDFSQIAAP